MSNLHKNVLPLDQAKQVLDQMSNTFDSHEFIIRFIIMFPAKYIDLLAKYKATGKAHGAIAAFLQENSDSLEIQHQGKIRSENIYGRDTLCEKWKKI